MKIIAIHLPQFHQIPENDKWWGEGFTEWTNLNKPNKFGAGLQPLLGQYNLLDKETMIMQNRLAKEYSIFGFCYYHYYFTGKKLLERPIENLLKWTDIDQPFCLYWANHDWKRSWEGKNEILIKQEYGDEKDWEKHFNYLKQFFLDTRYIKIDNKPVFVIFNIKFEEKEKIISFFDRKCKEIGFAGIYYVQSVYDEKHIKSGLLAPNTDAIFLREPGYSMKISFRSKVFNKIRRVVFKKTSIYTAKKIYTDSIKNAKRFPYNIKYFLGAFAMWNNTYRHGKRGYIIKKGTRKEFLHYIKALKQIAEEKNIEYCFYNAWNEWAEGMILEPDTKNKYMLLESIKEAME